MSPSKEECRMNSAANSGAARLEPACEELEEQR